MRWLDNPGVEDRLIKAMVKMMLENDAPPEQYERAGLTEYLRPFER